MTEERTAGTEGIAEEGELFRTHIGGAAVMEGIMMRGRLNWAVAVREPDGGIYVEEHDLPDPSGRAGWKRWPLVRGCVAFVESMVLSFKAMAIASDHAYPDDDSRDAPAETHADDATERTAGSDAATSSDGGTLSGWMVLSLVIGLALGVFLFVALPVGAANAIVGDYTTDNAITWNLVEAALRIVVFVAYIWAVGRMPDMARVFGYHGAEHETIHCFEHGVDLTPESCARFSRLHVRCGTAFILMTMIVAIVVNTFLPVAAFADSIGATGAARTAVVFCSRLLMVPVVAGIAYEVTVRWAGSHPDNPLVRIVLWPGLQMQRLTTRTPDAGMLECAIEALRRVDAREKAAGDEVVSGA
ncbi:MAG: DUF1385 domain-containing protein [Atopobiaceae bacterium]|jgi:uncharacterized protein YqhQ|nr:DUF1385 domain-containing protein [Atopobiaceae bacterium]MCI2173570.1 DUF1385 domain-containing protein [Atopobiaceae bacterium]MCI2207788.1 DUF1385 domain-containing protein [Atopobiaceae bacterium]